MKINQYRFCPRDGYFVPAPYITTNEITNNSNDKLLGYITIWAAESDNFQLRMERDQRLQTHLGEGGQTE